MSSFSLSLLQNIFSKTDTSIKRISLKNDGDYVILIPGLLLGPRSMNKIHNFLNNYGYQVLPLNCSIKKHSVQVLANSFLKNFIIKNCLNKKRKIHFITHSIGGIVVRKYLEDNHSLNIGKVVMLAPPNRGSEIMTLFSKMYFSRYLLGVSGKQISINDKAYLLSLEQKVSFDLGIIAGSHSNLLSLWYLNRKNDGVVSVENTKILGMVEHLVLNQSHYSMLYSKEVLHQILFFLRCGKFDK